MTKQGQSSNLVPINIDNTEIEIPIIERKNCKLCHSEFKAIAEEMYGEKKGINLIHKYLKKEGVDISYPAVRNHLVFHYNEQQKQIRIQEYGKNLQKWVDRSQNREEALDERIAVLYSQMYNIASETEEESLDEKRKSAEVIRKLVDTITVCEDKLDEIRQKIEPVEIVIKKLHDIVQVQISNARQPETKDILMKVVEELSSNINEFFTTKNK